ncbi:MAG: anhydro-N-acetylmuramic acid kinase [Pseudomonadota bacterium]
MADYFIGLMSGTSMDALDAVLVDFSATPPHLIATHSHALDKAIRHEILALAQPGDNELDRLAQLDVRLGTLSAQLSLQLLEQAQIDSSEVRAIGSHGQTVRHAPDAPTPYTVQIGDPNTIAQLSGITTVADFRRRDMVAGGQGAPLVPAFHKALFHSSETNRVVLNIGGIANISILPADNSQAVNGFDTGPGNMLMDAWIQLKQHQPYDENGGWARSGSVNVELLNKLLSDPYFSRTPPKSTGREQYNLHWLEQQLHEAHQAQDIQATLCELSATTIANAVLQFAPNTDELYVCGGGARNSYLMERISDYLKGCHISTTAELGVEPQWVEAMAFAWLARQTLLGLPGNLPAVTGARKAVILGGIYPAPPQA